jgi:hypothetical protein
MSRRTPIGFGKYVTVNSPSQVARQTFARLSLPGVLWGTALVSDPEPGEAGEPALCTDSKGRTFQLTGRPRQQLPTDQGFDE